MTLKERINFGKDCWGRASGSALQVCWACEPRVSSVRSVMNRTLCRIHLPRYPVGSPPGELITVTHQHPDVNWQTSTPTRQVRSLGYLCCHPLHRWTDCAAQKVVRWIMNYFSPSQGGVRTIHDALSGAITVTESMPVVLQHAGHSRTVVGYEVLKNGVCNLLVFDPSRYVRPVPLVAWFLMTSC